MDLASLKNPFVGHKQDDLTTLPPGDVPELHQSAMSQCSLAISSARDTGTSTGLMMVGEAGSGKSHLITQLRGRVASETDVVLLAVRLGGAVSGCLWRHLRERLVSELLRPYPTGKNNDNGLLRILRNRFPKLVTKDAAGNAIVSVIFGKLNPSDALKQCLDELAKSTPTFNYQLRKVLPCLLNQNTATLASAWLLGQSLNKEDYQTIGLTAEFPSDHERESISRSIVLSLLHLAGNATTLFIVFDEVEAIQAGNQDAVVLRQLATMATELLGEPGPRVVATSIRPTMHLTLKATVEVSNLQKMSQFTTQLPPLNWEQCVRITRARLDAEHSCRAARSQYAADPDWPLGREFLEREFEANRRSLTPRHLILNCAVEFQRLQKGLPEGSTSKSPKADDFNKIWEKQRSQFLKKPQSVQFDKVVSLTLPWLVQLFEPSLVRVQEKSETLGDINLLFEHRNSAKKPIGVSLCNQEPKSLWRRLDRLIEQWRKAKGKMLSELLVVKSESAVTATAQKKLDKLADLGACVVLLDVHQVAELAAFQSMLTNALEGKMTNAGRPIDSKEYDQWATENLSDAVKVVLQNLFGCCFKPTPAKTKTTEHRKAAIAGKK
jgi:hypothetical protein